MTIREHIQRRIRLIRGAAFAAWLVLFVCGLAYIRTESRWLLIAVVPSFIAFLAGIFYLYLGVRCPRCGGNVGYLNLSPSTKFPVRFCPFCGVSMDAERWHVPDDA